MKNLSKSLKWHLFLFIFSCFFILAHFVFYMLPAYKNWPLILGIIILGTPLLLEIIFKFLKGDFGADLLALIAIVTACFLEEYLAANIVISMLSSGQLLESYAIKRASFALSALAERMPLLAHKKMGDNIVDIPLSDIAPQDEIIIFPHEVAPVDGVVVEGHGFMDESYLTGEPYRVSKAPGAEVLSGAINGEILLVIKAIRKAAQSRYAQIMRVMEDAEQKKPKMRRLADQLGAIFAPLSLIFALIAWYITGDSLRFLSVLLIATPCPLFIAIPVCIISAISLAAKRGIIIRDPVILERLPTCKTAIFDKTGTLTYGEAELLEIKLFETFSEKEILQWVGSIERYSKHPLALAITKAIARRGIPYLEVEYIKEKPGQGMEGLVQEKNIFITDRKNLAKKFPNQVNQLPSIALGLECLILVDNKLSAIFSFRDTLRKEGSSFIAHLSPMHKFNKIIIISGDRPSEVEYLAKQLGVTNAYSNQTPEQKVLLIKEETKKAPTLFLGDGINDAPGLATATCGLAFGRNNKAVIEAGGAAILESSLSKVDELLHISESMRKVALQSALGGMSLAFIGMILAGFGLITPVMGAILQEIIDLLAIINALRLTLGYKMDVHV